MDSKLLLFGSMLFFILLLCNCNSEENVVEIKFIQKTGFNNQISGTIINCTQPTHKYREIKNKCEKIRNACKAYNLNYNTIKKACMDINEVSDKIKNICEKINQRSMKIENAC